MYDQLFSPIKINGLKLKNRVMFPAMGTRFCTDDGYVIDQLIDYHVARVKGGCGLNVTEAVSVYKPGAVMKMLQLTDDSYIPGLKKLTDAIHEAGGKACLQLWQAGMAACQTPGATVVVPSDLPINEHTIPGVSKKVIHECVQAFGDAAKRAVKAGFDAVEFHAAHNYSPHTFLTATFNHRTDEYGGSLENRARYLIESIQAIRANIPVDMPLLMRVSAQDDELPGGMTRDDIVEFCKIAKDVGVDALDISRGNLVTSAMRFEVPPIDVPRGFNVDNAAYIRKATGMPTIAVGRINDPEQAEEIIAGDKADMVVIGRGQICDPEFCNKAKAGKTEDILHCIGCNQGCYDRDFAGLPLSCLRNPSVGREAEFGALKPAAEPKKVLVIGGGVGGMDAAIMAKKFDHDVTLAEASDKLGGQFVLAGQAPRKEEMANAAVSRGEQVHKTGVKVELNTTVNEDYLDAFAPDAVIAAIGASPIVLDVPGADGANVYTAPEILTGSRKAGGDTIVIGGGLVGLEVAEYIRALGNDVTVVEMQDKIAKDVGMGRNASIMMSVMGAGIKSIVNAKCVEIKPDSIVVDIEGEEKILPAQSVVIAIGSVTNDSTWIADYCKSKNIVFKVIGDAKKARRAIDAIREGIQASIEINKA